MGRERWWALYHRSNEALTPDSPLSRRHAGASVLSEDGQILHDADDDLDMVTTDEQETR
jgi:hypothetical protein